jgi:FKBP-type peptidyl-prolyl cis-trans isomerase FklB
LVTNLLPFPLIVQDGKQFDSSYDRGEPLEFAVNQVISGWTEALQLMKGGDKWEVYIPWQLAYGEQGAGGDIKPYQALIFTVHLLSINGKEEL